MLFLLVRVIYRIFYFIGPAEGVNLTSFDGIYLCMDHRLNTVVYHGTSRKACQIMFVCHDSLLFTYAHQTYAVLIIASAVQQLSAGNGRPFIRRHVADG